MHRLNGGDLTNNGDTLTTAIKMDKWTSGDVKDDSLSLRSVDKIDIGFGMHYYYATQSSTTDSTGSMTIKYDGSSGGTYSSSFDVYLDLHEDSRTGTIRLNDLHKHFVTTNAAWSTTPIGGAPIIPGVNDDHFYTTGVAPHDAGDGSIHTVTHSKPEPGTFITGGMSMLMAFGFARRLRKRAA